MIVAGRELIRSAMELSKEYRYERHTAGSLFIRTFAIVPGDAER